MSKRPATEIRPDSSEEGLSSRAIAEAEVVFVGLAVESSPEGPSAVCLLDVGFVEGRLWQSAQAGQLWVFGPAAELDASTAASLEHLGASVAHAADGAEAWSAVAKHLRNEIVGLREKLVRSSRELTTLGRELNKALSALSDTHSVLGLMPSVTLDEIKANRHVQVQLQPENPWSLMSRLDSIAQRPFSGDGPDPSGAALDGFGSDDVEVQRLREELEEVRLHLDLLQGTKTMRFMRAPRRVYGRIRRTLGPPNS